MGSISSINLEHLLLEKDLRLVNLSDLEKLFAQDNPNTLKKSVARLIKYEILERIDKGKYLLKRSSVDDWEIANWLISPSYVSLESALTHYGILSQFTYPITSITTRKANKNKVAWKNKEFEYTRISPGLFWGYKKYNNILLASPEKAVLDMLYLVSKGLRRIDTAEWDWSSIDKCKLTEYSKLVPYLPLQKLFKTLKF